VISHRPKEDIMQSVALLDSVGRLRSPATLPTFHQGRPPHIKGLGYPPDPSIVEEIITVMRAAGSTPDGLRLRAHDPEPHLDRAEGATCAMLALRVVAGLAVSRDVFV
jgi:hypothetical protein